MLIWYLYIYIYSSGRKHDSKQLTNVVNMISVVVAVVTRTASKKSAV